MSRLQNGDRFPELTIPVIGGRRLTLPQDLAGSYAVILFYRGAWCPYCGAQLGAFARSALALAELGVKVVALSVDDEEKAAALAVRLRLEFPVGYGVDPDAIAEATGAYVNHTPRYLQSTGFVLEPGGTVITAVYSSGAIGRLMPDDVMGLVRYVAAHA